jgi:hypothetical protein
VLRRFIHTAQPGPESVRATQLYHIVGAVAELRQVRLFERVAVVSNSPLENELALSRLGRSE